MQTDRKQTFWEELSPLWMFRCRPADFRWFGNSICPGIFWLPGMLGLLGAHFVSFLGCWLLWQRIGLWTLSTLLPLIMLWIWFVVADVKFRLQSPNGQEQAGFDNLVINWFGLVSTVAFYFILLPGGIVALLWWWLA